MGEAWYEWAIPIRRRPKQSPFFSSSQDETGAVYVEDGTYFFRRDAGLRHNWIDNDDDRMGETASLTGRFS